MKNISTFFLSVIFIFLSINNVVNAIGCKELTTPKKINDFMKKSYTSSPMLQKNVSLTLILDVCEGIYNDNHKPNSKWRKIAKFILMIYLSSIG